MIIMLCNFAYVRDTITADLFLALFTLLNEFDGVSRTNSFASRLVWMSVNETASDLRVVCPSPGNTVNKLLQFIRQTKFLRRKYGSS